jgi:outer membrane protein assembly factor BamB
LLFSTAKLAIDVAAGAAPPAPVASLLADVLQGLTLRRLGLGLAILLGSGLLFATALLVSSAAPDAAVDTRVTSDSEEPGWPMFGGSPARNMVNRKDRGLPGDWSAVWTEDHRGPVVDLAKSKNVKWVARLGTRAYGGPVVAGGKVFVGTNNGHPRDPKVVGDRGIVMCFRASDGQFLWQAVHGKHPGGQDYDWPMEGIVSTPAVAGSRVYYVSNRGELVCVSAEPRGVAPEGSIFWKLDMPTELGVRPHNMSSCSPLIVGDRLFVVTSNGVDSTHTFVPAPDAPSFLAVNRWTGKVLWKDSSPGKNILHGQWSNPAYAEAGGRDLVIFPGGDGWLYGFNPGNGKLLWKFDANPKDSEYHAGGKGTRSDFLATPVVVGDRCYISTGQDPEHYEGVGHLWCIDITRTGDISPELALDGKVPSTKTKANPNSGVVWHYGGPVKKEDAARLGRDYYFGRTLSTVAVQDGLVYAAELAGYLHCLDARTGEHYWVHDLKAAVWGSPYWVDGKVYMTTEDGDVWIFKHGRVKAEPRKIEMEQPIRSTPTVVEGVLYLMTESNLYAIASK